MDTSNSKTAWMVGVGVAVVIALGGWLWWSNQAASEPAPQTGDAEYSVYVKDQRPGSVVMVDRVLLKNGGYVTIHEMGATTRDHGALLGTSYWLAAGETLNVPISLSRPSKDKEVLVADLHEETDGDKKFTYGKDEHAMVNSEPVSAMFTIDASLPAQYDSKQ